MVSKGENIRLQHVNLFFFYFQNLYCHEATFKKNRLDCSSTCKRGRRRHRGKEGVIDEVPCASGLGADRAFVGNWPCLLQHQLTICLRAVSKASGCHHFWCRISVQHVTEGGRVQPSPVAACAGALGANFQSPRLGLCTSLPRLMRTAGFLYNQPSSAASLIWSPGGIFR